MEEFDKYDILDFLENEYIDYLRGIDKKHFTKNRTDIEKRLITSTDAKICDFLIDHMNIDFDTLIFKNITKIDLILFKYYFEKKKNMYLEKFKKNTSLFMLIFNKKNLEFNKFIMENIYSKLYSNAHNKKKIFKDEIEYIIQGDVNYTNHYNVFFYISEYFNLLYLVRERQIHIKRDLFFLLNSNNPITNFDELQEIIKKMGISKIEFENNILIRIFSFDKIYLLTICKSGDIELFIKVINNYKLNVAVLTNLSIVEIFVEAVKSNNIDFVIILLNYFKGLGAVITETHYTDILNSIFRLPNYTTYHNAIIGFIELGGNVVSNPVYRDYAESIEKI